MVERTKNVTKSIYAIKKWKKEKFVMFPSNFIELFRFFAWSQYNQYRIKMIEKNFIVSTTIKDDNNEFSQFINY